MAPGNSYQSVKKQNITTQTVNQATQSWSSNTKPTCSGRGGGVLEVDTNSTRVSTLPWSPPHNKGTHSDSEASPRAHTKDHRGDQMMKYHGQKVKMTESVPIPDPPSQDLTVSQSCEWPEEEETEDEYPSPICHAAGPGNELQDWEIPTRKEFLILGDTNIGFFPQLSYYTVQADSYPGATFNDFKKLIMKSGQHYQVQVLILSVGLYNRDEDADSATIEQLRSMHEKASCAFPSAEIWIPIINFSPRLSTAQKNKLHKINLYIQQNFSFLHPLPQELFHTQKNNIHWTPETASGVLSHWCRQLNTTLPGVTEASLQ